MGRRQKKINSPISVYKNNGDEVAHSIKESLNVGKDYFFQLGNPDENSNGFDNDWKLEVERDLENHNFPPGDLNSLLTANSNQPRQLNTARRHVNKPIDLDMVLKALEGVKNGRASGVDDIPNEILKQGGIENSLALLFELCHKWKTTPRQWKEGIIVPIYKKGDPLKTSNYRGITLLSCVGKLYSRVIDRQLRIYLEKILVEEQAGFRVG